MTNMDNVIAHNQIKLKRILTCLCGVSLLCVQEISSIILSIGISGIARTIILMSLCYIPFFLLLLTRPKQIPMDAIVIIVTAVLFFYVTIFMHPEYQRIVESEMWSTVVSPYSGVIYYSVFRLFQKNSDLYSIIIISSIFLFVFYFIQSINAISAGYWIVSTPEGIVHLDYSMTFGYKMLLPCLVFISVGLNQKKVFFIVLGCIAAGEILMLGSRASFLCVLVYLLLFIIFIRSNEIEYRKKIQFFIIIIIISVLIVLFYQQILEAIGSVFESIGFSSRTIQRIINGSIAEDPIRHSIYDMAIEKIQNNWIVGYGMLSDRYFFGTYCHNMFLEIFMQFGLIVGAGIILLLFINIFKGFFIKQNSDFKQFFIVFFSCSIVRLMVSYSFWDDSNFWIMLAILKHLLEKNKMTKESCIYD
ncbi:O-antigen ligase like membrane protein [Ruminococcaceae bacterium FB2012]|nr:O-antigen ligase like membrane protein [Ruminococcaceae bacterium FB2012]